MSWIVTNYPTTPLSELKPANPFHDGFKSLREGDWQFFGVRSELSLWSPSDDFRGGSGVGMEGRESSRGTKTQRES